MSRFLRPIAAAFAVFTLLAVGAECRAGQPEEGVGLGRAREGLNQLLPLTIAQAQLKLDRDAWQKQEEAESANKKKDGDAAGDDEGIGFGGGQNIIVGGGGVVRIQGNRILRGNSLPRPGKLFAKIMDQAGGGASGGSSSSRSNNQLDITHEGQLLSGRLTYDSAAGGLSFRFVEKGGDRRLLAFEDDDKVGMTLRLNNPTAKTALLFLQAPDGPVCLVYTRDQKTMTATAEDFMSLVRQEPNKVQALLFRPLAEVGIEPPVSPYLPPAMALACSGYSAPAPEVARRADELIAKLAAEDMEVREKATAELTELFPLAIQYLTQAAGKTEDAEVKMRLAKVVAAHPNISKARPIVESLKLQDDPAYLLNILAQVPFLKPAARARLALVVGKDYGDDPAAWPKYEGHRGE